MHRILLATALCALTGPLLAQTPLLLPQPTLAALANEVSGETAKRNLEGLARLHRQRGSQGFHAAAELIAERARAYGLSNVEILRFPADGKIFYGTQRSRLAWDAEEGELSETRHGTEIKMASYAAEPIVLAEDSESADVTAELVDVGDGTQDSDYAGKEVSGKLVLVASPASMVQDLAIGKLKAVGIISYAQNQKTAWLGDNDNLIRWGHLESFSSNPTFAFQVSLRTARALKDRLLHGEQIRLHALVKAGQQLNARPDLAQHIKVAIHMDMVGGGPETKSVFHVTRGPLSLPSFVHDVAWSFASWVNEQSYGFAAGGRSDYPLIAPEGGKEPLRAEYSAYTMGSDHDVYQDSSFGIPAVYFNDWPDRYIHTNFDSAANIDPTKLKRVAFIGAASGYFLANFSAKDLPATRHAVAVGKLLRAAQVMQRGQDATVLEEYEAAIDTQLGRPDIFTRVPPPGSKSQAFQRRTEPRGEMMVFGYDYFTDHWKGAAPKLLSYEGSWGSGEEFAYEALNFVNGTRSVRQITDALSIEYGPIPLELVQEYLQALEKIGVLQRR